MKWQKQTTQFVREPSNKMIRIGHGYDVHQLSEHLPFTLGGIVIPHAKGCVGHSDADVLIHAICDALLGAANMNDIGFHFPDTEERYKGIDSKVLLKDVHDKIQERGYRIGNIDGTICLQKPKIAPYILKMKEVLSRVLEISIDKVSIKATTTEKLGFVGREEGIEAHAVVLIIHRDAFK